ncbi:unnamed protein product, partial [Ectocarpus sp. 4 AP-2014]
SNKTFALWSEAAATANGPASTITRPRGRSGRESLRSYIEPRERRTGRPWRSREFPCPTWAKSSEPSACG